MNQSVPVVVTVMAVAAQEAAGAGSLIVWPSLLVQYHQHSQTHLAVQYVRSPPVHMLVHVTT